MPGLTKELAALKVRGGWSLDTRYAGLRAALHAASASNPRYLFRAWSAHSGGNARVNTVHAITPKAFLASTAAPQHIFDVECAQLQGLIAGHLGGEHVDTPFSSWSHSLPIVLSMVTFMRNAHISVIDTHRLEPANFIFHCGHSSLEDFGLPLFGEEFLVFGIVRGDAYQAVPYMRVEEHIRGITRSAYASLYDDRISFDQYPTVRIDSDSHAVAFGKKFGLEWELPMAVCMLAVHGRSAEDTTLRDRLIREMKVPEAWNTDAEFSTVGRDSVGYAHEADSACRTLVAIAKQLREAGRLPGVGGEGERETTSKRSGGEGSSVSSDLAIAERQETTAQEDDQQEQETAQITAPIPKKHLKKTSRMPRAVYELYIDMVGFHQHNLALGK